MKAHVKTTRPLRSLHAPLLEWTALNRRIGRKWDEFDDMPWRYNERALLSLFAGAVWRTGGDAFEEFSETKFRLNDRSEGHGRVDLWFTTSGGEFRAEAKRQFIPITKEVTQQDRLHELMASAVKDARRNLADRGRSRRLAIIFAVPYVRKQKATTELAAKIERFTGWAETVDHDAIAWIFPDLNERVTVDNWVCPGIAMLIKIVKRSPNKPKHRKGRSAA